MQDEKKNTANTDEILNIEQTAAMPEEDKAVKIAKPKPRRSKKDVTPVSESTSETDAGKKSEGITDSKTAVEDNILDAPSLDSLIIDDAPLSPADKTEENGRFDDFLADYKNVIKKTLSAAKAAFSKDSLSEAESTSEKQDTEAEEGGEEGLIIEDSDTPQLSMNIDEKMLPEEEMFFDDPEESKDIYDPEKPRIIDNIFDFVELFIFTLAAVLVLTTFFFKHTIVDGPSMMNTLHHGEHLIISDLFYTPERGDIVVFADYSAGQTEPYVKRVIAVAGDTVTVDGKGGVKVNGEKIDESDYVFIDGKIPYDGKTVIVPEGEVFVLGDHRNNSYDSASFPHGTIKVDSILGKVLFRIYPFDKIGTVK